MADDEVKPAEQVNLSEKLAAEITTAPTAEEITIPEEESSEEKNDSAVKNEHKLEEKSSEPKASTTNDDAESKAPSQRVQEGRSYNSRHTDRGRGGRGGSQNDRDRYKHNIKSDLTSQEESSDPVAIRKQVQ